MKIKYSKRRLFSNLVLGALFIILGVVKGFEGTAGYFSYFQLFMGFFLVGCFFYQKKNQYLTIENGYLTKNFLRRKTVKLDQVVQVLSFPGRIKIFTPNKSLSINTSVIDEDSLRDLYPVLGSLELDPQENPFLGWSRARS